VKVVDAGWIGLARFWKWFGMVWVGLGWMGMVGDCYTLDGW